VPHDPPRAHLEPPVRVAARVGHAQRPRVCPARPLILASTLHGQWACPRPMTLRLAAPCVEHMHFPPPRAPVLPGKKTHAAAGLVGKTEACLRSASSLRGVTRSSRSGRRHKDRRLRLLESGRAAHPSVDTPRPLLRFGPQGVIRGQATQCQQEEDAPHPQGIYGMGRRLKSSHRLLHNTSYASITAVLGLHPSGQSTGCRITSIHVNPAVSFNNPPMGASGRIQAIMRKGGTY
jgi:hypothetical protein